MDRGEQKNIINEILDIFDSFAVVNLEQSTYAYHSRSGNDAHSELAQEGDYTDLLHFLYCGICPLGDESATLEEYLDPVSICRQMTPGRELLQWEYEDREESHKTLYAMCIEREDDVPVRLLLAMKSSGGQTEASRFFDTKEASLSALANMAPDAESHEPVWVCLEQEYQGRRVLVAEDNTLNREITEEYLRMAGAEVDTVANGKEAIGQVAGAPEGYYDMILMDVQMPVMNGYDAAKAIRLLDREQTGRIPIVAMTSGSPAEDTALKGAGMNGCLTKPVRPRQLRELLGQFLV